MRPTNVRLIVRTAAGDALTVNLMRPELDSLTDALGDLFSRTDCDSCVADVRVEFNGPGGQASIACPDPTQPPESIAAYLWEELAPADS
ncbi:hypothetical protein EON82_02950 [bacterium]|nr:MAG: hypothetical protein EON82_02950 [bacterium]